MTPYILINKEKKVYYPVYSYDVDVECSVNLSFLLIYSGIKLKTNFDIKLCVILMRDNFGILFFIIHSK